MPAARPLVRRAASPFARIVVGIDGTEPGDDACRQAARLLAVGGEIEVFSAVQLAGATSGEWSPEQVATELEHRAGHSLERARRIAGSGAASRLVDGPAADSLLHELERRRATLVAVGGHAHLRGPEPAAGSVAVAMLRGARCSVLVARPCSDAATFPRRIVVGVDGSEASDPALAAAQELADRFAASLRVVAAVGGKDLDLARAQCQTPVLDTLAADRVSALVEASDGADLMVVGGRGGRGRAGAGSVSERVARGAGCSILVVR